MLHTKSKLLLCFSLIQTSTIAQLPNSFNDIPSTLQESTVAWFPMIDDYEDISTNPIEGIPSGSLTFENNNGSEPFDSYLSFGGGIISLGSPEKLKWPNMVEGAFSVWLRPQNTSGDGRLFSSENPECCNSIEFRDEQSTSTYAGVGFNLIGAYEIVQIPYEDWSHVLVNAEPFGQDSILVSIYLNNEIYHMENPQPVDTNLPIYGYSDMFIGQKAASAYDKWKGDAAHMCWFNRSLTEVEMAYLFQGGTQPGCTDPSACNYDASADLPDGSCVASGCMDEYACNYDAAAGCDDGSCDYSCCPGPGCCSEGMFWDWDSLACYVSKPADINMDGCVQLNDLLDLLSAYGDCAAAEWACGDPLKYQGYDYTTVQIGDQCWFAENVRYLPSVSSPDVGSEDDGQPHAYVYGYSGTDTTEATSYESYVINGALYNFPAINQWELCPSGWTVPSDSAWMELELSLGINPVELNWYYPNQGFERGYDENVGAQLKASDWDGDGISGFNARPSGWRWDNTFAFQEYANFWTSSALDGSVSWSRILSTGENGIGRQPYYPHFGKSVRCVKN